MLEHLGETKVAEQIFIALNRVLTKGKHRTRDLGGDASTHTFTEAISQEMELL